jgi:hypothetical protein
LSILIVILVSCALNSDNGLIKALSCILLPNLVFSARPTSLNVEVVVGRRVVTLVATKCFHIPNWLVLGTAGISTQVNLTLMGGIAEVFVLLAGAVVVALVMHLLVVRLAMGLVDGHWVRLAFWDWLKMESR